MSHRFSIIHLSDLHFGRIHPETLEHLDEFLIKRNDEIKLAIVTGDLTQRARRNEFMAATKFMQSLNHPLFVVPGNHDVPLYNLWLRFFKPYRQFLKYLGPFSQNYYEDENVAVFGLWTVNNFAAQSGKLRRSDLLELEERFKNLPPHKIKIIACHHPLVSIKHPRIKDDMKRITDLSPHFILWGHEHQSSVIHMIEDRIFPMIVASGTTTSSRLRSEANSFNYLRFFKDHIHIETFRHARSEGTFEMIARKEIRTGEDKSPLLELH